MARKKIRKTSTFSLSFLDIMSCGLGAAVLIFLLLKHVVDSPVPNQDPQDLSEIRTVVAQGLARKIEEDIKELKSLLEEIQPDSPVDVPGLKAKLARLERQKEALETTVANLPIASDFQVLSFNEEVSPVFGENMNEWYEVGDRISVAAAVAGVNKIVPENGTNMHKVFETAMSMTPQPDNIFLITDGLPTQGDGAPDSGRRCKLAAPMLLQRGIGHESSKSS